MARREFGTTGALGKTLLVKTSVPATTPGAQPTEAFQPFTITGIAKDCPQNSSIKFEASCRWTLTLPDMRSGKTIGSAASSILSLSSHPALTPIASNPK